MEVLVTVITQNALARSFHSVCGPLEMNESDESSGDMVLS
jgi:hypothetical protein